MPFAIAIIMIILKVKTIELTQREVTTRQKQIMLILQGVVEERGGLFRK